MSANQNPYNPSVRMIWPDVLPTRTRTLFYEAIGQLTVLHALASQELPSEQAAAEAAKTAEITACLEGTRDRYNQYCNWSFVPLAAGAVLGMLVPPAGLVAAGIVGVSSVVCAGTRVVAVQAEGFARQLTGAAAAVAPQETPISVDPQIEA